MSVSVCVYARVCVCVCVYVHVKTKHLVRPTGVILVCVSREVEIEFYCSGHGLMFVLVQLSDSVSL